MRNLLKSTKFAVLLALLVALGLAAPQINAAINNPNAPIGVGGQPGVNIDVPFGLDPICGFQIIVTSATAPTSFYNSGRNPWGAPTVTETPPGSGIWVLTFGPGPCFSHSDPLFYEGGVFKGLHFGFWTNVSLVQFQGAPCWLIGSGTVVPCTGITGHNAGGGGVNVLNGTAQALALRNVEAAFSPGPIPINDLTRDQQERLPWQTVRLSSDLLPASTEGQPGSLRLDIPENILSQKGFVVFSYDVNNAETGENLSTVTLEFELPGK
jgi:hypothetical protein